MGSALAFSHGRADQDDPELATRIAASFAVYTNSATPPTMRDRTELVAVADDMDVAPPGLVDISRWPDSTEDAPVGMYGLLARQR